MKQATLGFVSGMFFMILFILTMEGCLDSRTTTHFYVKSSTGGYKTCIDNGITTTCLGKPFNDPTDANMVVKELNRDMEGNWEK